MSLFLLIAGFVALAYQVVALAAAIRHRARSRYPAPAVWPAISVLKPIRGLDDNLEAALRSNLEQDYPGEFEVLFGVQRPDDPALPVIEKLGAHPTHTPTTAPNGKVGVLIDLAREARHAVCVVNDSDILVPRDYLRRIVAPLASPGVGLVTCLYRAQASSWAGRWEALGINTDFMPSTLVAPLVGVREFGMGSTLCFRRTDLDRMGGFEAIADYIADDYQLARRIGRAHLSEVVVETHLSDPGWRAVWQHQVRWARTIRVSRGGGFLGLPVTHAGLWALLNLFWGAPWMAALLCGMRVAMGVSGGWGVLRARAVLAAAPLIPLWDLWAFTVWLAGLFGSKVRWRDKTLTLTREGRLRA